MIPGPLELEFARSQALRRQRKSQTLNHTHSHELRSHLPDSARKIDCSSVIVQSSLSNHAHVSPESLTTLKDASSLSATPDPPATEIDDETPEQRTNNDEASNRAFDAIRRIRKRRKTHVNTLSEKIKATKWMIAHSNKNGEKHIASKCVRQFPEYFHGNDKSSF